MTLPVDCLQFFAKFIEEKVGIVYSEVNYYQLEDRLNEIARQAAMSDALELWSQAKTLGIQGTTLLLLVDIATNNETSFFRDQSAFRAIAKIVSEPRQTKGQPLRIWSAACSYGQEVYSLAMMLDEMQIPSSILGTDISERVLARARQGRYTQLEVQRGLNAAQLVRYFDQDKCDEDPLLLWSVKKNLQQNVTFRKLNLLDPWFGSDQYDLILCRNVLIYQTVSNKKKVIEKLEERLTPGGYLILGGAESLIGISDSLTYSLIEGGVAYRKPLELSLRAAS